MPINSDMDMYAGFFDYITVFSVWGGVTITLMCLLHGLLFITLRTEEDIQDRARRMAKRVWFITVPALVIFVVLAYFNTDMFQVRPVLVPLMIGIVVVMYVLSALFIWKIVIFWHLHSADWNCLHDCDDFRVTIPTCNDQFYQQCV